MTTPRRDAIREQLRAHIATIPINDTHEHLLAESTRLRGPGAHDMLPCSDAALLLWHYCSDDLRSAGMPSDAMAAVFSPNVAPGSEMAAPAAVVERHSAHGIRPGRDPHRAGPLRGAAA